MGVDVKICGIRKREDAELAAELGAHAIGFVFDRMSPRYVGHADWHPDWIAELKPLKVGVHGIVYSALPHADFGVIQGVEWPNPYPEERMIWRAYRLLPSTTPKDVLEAASGADAMILDSYVPGRYGGTGHTADWGQAAEIVKELTGKVRVGLAGGLKPENVASAVAKVAPDFVDVSSGVESAPGQKDQEKIRAFFAAVG